MNKIINLHIELLEEHPKNPRKSIGDISELTESIKVNGIMQNLTVVPWSNAHPDANVSEISANEGKYTLVIGHRRYNAAKAAGIIELPCVISDMSYKEQLGCMLTENLQRADLSVIEQAYGFQLMLDLGDSISDVASQTGFSESTVRRRVKLMELGEEQLEKLANKQITFEDIEKLDKIKDKKAREKVLKSIGTKSFNDEYSKALDKQARSEIIASWKKKLSEMSNFTEITAKTGHGRGYKHESSFNVFNNGIENLDKYQNGEYYYFWDYENWVYIKIKLSAEEAKLENEADRKRLEEANKRAARVAKLKSEEKRFAALRRDFIESYPESKAIENLYEIVEFIKNTVKGNIYLNLSTTISKKTPAKTLLTLFYFSIIEHQNTFYYDGQFSKNPIFNAVYELLKKLGYEMSDEEEAFYNGTSELYYRK